MIVILVVSGEGRIGRHVRSVLGSQGWWVTTAAGREEALRASADHQPALVIVDCEVEGAGELVRAFGSKNGGPGVLLLESADGGDGAFGAFEAGADQILSKPPRAQELIEAADRVMSLPHQSSAAGALNLGQKLSSDDIFGDLLVELGETAVPPAAQPEEPGSAMSDVSDAEVEAEAHTEAGVDADTEVEAGIHADAEVEVADIEVEAEVHAEAEAEAHAEPEADTDSDAEVEAGLHADAEVEAEADEEADVEAEVDAEVAGAAVEAEAEAEGDAAVEADAEVAEAEVQVEAETGIDTEVEVQGAEIETGIDTEAEVAELEEGSWSGIALSDPADSAGIEPPVSSSWEAETDLLIEGVEPRIEQRAPAAGFIVDPSVEQLVAQLKPSIDDADPETLVESAAEDGSDEEGEEAKTYSEAGAQSAEPAQSSVGAGARAESDAPEDLPLEIAEVSEEQSLAEASVAPPVLIEPQTDGEETRFGQYRLDERIAVGGMAEVWRASMLGMEGFRKTVAIKKILPHLAENSEFVTMFIEEAKLAARLTHENLVEIYDLGRIGASYFIAMEYVDGRDLRSLLNRLRQRSEQMPIGLALLVGAEVSRGLEYAHTRQDGDGNPMALVHRDVSPRNVLVGHDGRVRLCDFGVAKAVSSVIQTEIGALKGKLQYMSPEQASGKPVDARSDIYSLGSVMYEMITGRRLYEADNEISLLDAVRAGAFDDPRKHCPGLPQEVRRILIKALAKRPSARYQTAGAMGQNLTTLLRTLDPVPSEQTLSGFASGLFSEAPVESPAGEADLEAVSTPGAVESDLHTRSVVGVAPTARSKVVRFWWGVAAGLLAAGLVAGGIKLLFG